MWAARWMALLSWAVAVAGQSVAHDFAAAGFDGRGACVAGEAVGAGEAADVADVAEDLGGEHVADPGELGQGVAAGGDGGCAASTVLREGAVEAPHVDEEVAGHLLALDSTPSRGRTLASRAAAVLVLSWVGAPPAIRSRRCRCSRLIVRRRSLVSSSRRSASSRSTRQ